MKKFLMFVPAAMMAMLTSCGDNTVLSAGAAEDAIEMDVLWENPVNIKTFQVGDYQVGMEELEALRSLKAAGVITLTEKLNGSYADVTVTITEEGSKYLFEGDLISGREDLFEELSEITKGNYPEYVTPALATIMDSVDSVGRREAIMSFGSIVNFSNDPMKNVSVQGDAKPEKPACWDVNVIVANIEVVEAKEVRCTEEQAKNGKGSAKIVFEYSDVTPFGIVKGYKDGEKFTEDINFERYEDLGWVVAKGNE